MAGPFGPQPGGEKKKLTSSSTTTTTTAPPKKKITPFVPSSGGVSSSGKPLFVPKGGSGGGGGDKKARSLFQQWTDAAKGIAPGLLGMAKQGVQSVYRPTVAVALGQTPELDTSSVGSLIGSAAQHYSPLVSSLGTSVGHTGTRLVQHDVAMVNLARGKGSINDSPYVKASKEGRILDVWLEDVGNAAIVAGVAGKLAGSVGSATGAAEAATRLEAAAADAATARAAGNVAAEQAARQAAVEASGAQKALRPRGLAGQVGKVAPRLGATIETTGEALKTIERGANRLASPAPFLGPTSSKLFEKATGDRPGAFAAKALAGTSLPEKSAMVWRRVTNEGRKWSELMAATDDEVMAESQRWADVGHIARQAGLSDIEMTTARLVADQRLEPLGAARARLSDSEFDKLVQKVWGERETPTGRVRVATEERLRPTPDEARAALDYQPGVNPGLDKTIEALKARMAEDSAARGYAPGADTLVDGWEDTEQGKAFLERYDARTEAMRQADPTSFDWQAREIERNNHTIDPFKEEPSFGLEGGAIAGPRRRLEGLTEAARRQAARDTTEALKAQRIAKASQALRMEIPAPESPWQSFNRGTEVGRAEAMVARRQAAMVATQARLSRLLAEYEAATEAADVERLAKQLDRETARWFDDQAQLEYLQERHGLATTFDKGGPIYERGTGKRLPPEEPPPGPEGGAPQPPPPEPPPLVTGPHMTRRYEARTEATAAPRLAPSGKRLVVPRHGPKGPEAPKPTPRAAPKVSTPETEALRANIAAAKDRMEAAKLDAAKAGEAPLTPAQAAAVKKRLDAAEVAVQVAKGPKQKRAAMRKLQAAKDAAQAPARRKAEAALKRYRAARAEVRTGEKALARLESPPVVRTEGRRTIIPKEGAPNLPAKAKPVGAVRRLSSKPVTEAEWSPAKARHADTAARASDVAQEASGTINSVGTVLIPEKVPFGGDVAEHEAKIGRKLHGKGGEHDWITEGHVDPAEVARLTANGHITSDWSKGGTTPDKVPALLTGDISEAMDVGDAMDRWLEATRRMDAAAVLEAGGRRAETLDQQFAAYGFGSSTAFSTWLNDTFGAGVHDARSELEAAAASFEATPREVASTIRDLPKWIADLFDAETRLDAARKAPGYDAEWGSPAADAAQSRTAALLPTPEAQRLWDAGDIEAAHRAALDWLDEQRVVERQTAGERGGRARLNRRLLEEKKQKATPKLLLTKAMRDEAATARDFLYNEGLADMMGKTEEAGGLLGAAATAAKGANDLLEFGAAQAYEGGKALSDMAEKLDAAIKAGDASALRKLMPEARELVEERKAAAAGQAVQDVAQEARVVADDINRIKSRALKGFVGELELQGRHSRLLTPEGRAPKGMAEWQAALEARAGELAPEAPKPEMPVLAPAAQEAVPPSRSLRSEMRRPGSPPTLAQIHRRMANAAKLVGIDPTDVKAMRREASRIMEVPIAKRTPAEVAFLEATSREQRFFREVPMRAPKPMHKPTLDVMTKALDDVSGGATTNIRAPLMKAGRAAGLSKEALARIKASDSPRAAFTSEMQELARVQAKFGADNDIPRRLPAEPKKSDPIIVISCGSAKAGRACPVSELYVSKDFKGRLAAARRLTGGRDENIRVLSGEHGLLRLDQIVEPYNTKMGDPGAINVREGGFEQLAQQTAELPGNQPIGVLGPKAYKEALARALGDRPLVDLHEGLPAGPAGGIGAQKQRANAIANGAYDPFAATVAEGGATARVASRFRRTTLHRVAAEGGEVPPPPGGTAPPGSGDAAPSKQPGGAAASNAARQAALDVARQRGKVERQTQVVARLRRQLESAIDANSAEVPRLARRLDAVQSELTRREADLADGERLAESVGAHAKPTPAEEAIARSWGYSKEADAPAGGYNEGSGGAQMHERGASAETIQRRVKPGGSQARIAEDARIQERHAAAVRKAKASNARVLRLERRWADYPAEVARSAQENLVDVSKRGTSRVVRTAYRTLGDYGLKRIGGYTEWKGIGGETQAAITGQLGRTLRQAGMTEVEHAEVMAAFRDVWDGRQAGDPGYSADYLDALHSTSVGRRLGPDAWRDLERSSAIEDAVIDVNLLTDDAMTYKRSGRYIENPRRARAIIDRLDFLPADRVNELDKAIDEWRRSRERTITDRGVSIEAIPRRYRPAAITARRSLQAYMDTADELVAQGVAYNVVDDVLRLAADTPSNLEGLVGMGLDPAYFTGGAPVDRLPGRMRGITRKTLRAGKKMQTGAAVKSLEDTVKLQAVEAIKAAHNRANDQIAVTFGRSVDDVIGDQLREYRRTHGENMAPADVERAMTEAGWKKFNSPGGAQPVWIPEQVAKAAAAQTSQAGWGWQTLARFNRAYKTMVLPFSARWYTGNIIGNAMMAWVGGGTSPLAMMRARKRMGWDDRGIIRSIVQGSLPGKKGAAIREQLAQQIATGALDFGGKRAGRLSSAGLLSTERLALGLTDLGESQALTRPGRRVEKIATHGYAVNEFVDNFMRSMVWMDRLEAEVRKTVEATGRGILTDAERAAASEAAMTTTLNAMGDFSKMTPNERLRVRQVIPFYAWMKHSTQFIMRLPIEHPGRAVFLLRLNDLFSDPDMQGDMIDMIGGRLPMPGGGYLDLRFLSPFQDPTRMPLLPNELAKSVSPFIKIGVAATTGIDLNKMGQVTRPPNRVPRGVYGETIGRALLSPDRLGELAGYTTSQIPLAARTRDVVLGPKVRYGTGAVVKSKGKPLESNRSRLGQGLGILGIPFPEKVDAAGIAARKRKRITKQTK